MLNDESLLFWTGWAYCPDYAEAATRGVLYKNAVLRPLLVKSSVIVQHAHL